jgi:hypothetical protein
LALPGREVKVVAQPVVAANNAAARSRDSRERRGPFPWSDALSSDPIFLYFLHGLHQLYPWAK